MRILRDRAAALMFLDTPLPYDRRRALKGDLDAIVLRAMAKQPEDRYGSAEELSEDVGRFIAGAPVIAREPSFGYVMRKLAAAAQGGVRFGGRLARDHRRRAGCCDLAGAGRDR